MADKSTAASADAAANGPPSPTSQVRGAIVYACIANWQTHNIVKAGEVKIEAVSKKDRNATGKYLVEDKFLSLTANPTEKANSMFVMGKDTDNALKCCITNHSGGKDISVISVFTTDFDIMVVDMFHGELNDEFVKSTDDSAFVQALEAKMELFNTEPQSRAGQIFHKLDQVKEVLIDNVEKTVQRHGQIDINLEATSSLVATSQTFKSNSQQLKKGFEWKLYKQYMSFALVCLCIIGVLVIVICVTVKC